jgi:integron integrase
MSYAGESVGVTAEKTPRLLDQVRTRLRLKHYSLRTEQAYIGWIRRFILATGKRHPRDMGVAEVESFLSSLAVQGQVAAGTQNQALAALLFLYREVLSIELPWMETIVRAKRPQRVPVVLSRDEVARLLAMMDGRFALMASLLYGSGLRLMECVRLRVKDVDFELNQICVRDGKGGKDRHVPLPRRLGDLLRAQLERVTLIHGQDLAAGHGSVWLPHALARKYPSASRAICFSFGPTFARSAGRCHAASSHRRRWAAARGACGAPSGKYHQAGDVPHLASLVRHPPAGGGPRHPHHPGTARSQGRGHHADLYACTQSRWSGCVESAGSLRFSSCR